MAGENSYEKSIEQVKSDITTIIGYMTQLDERVASSATNLANAAKKLSAASPNEMNGAIESQKKGLTELNAVMAEQSREAEKLALKKKSLAMLTGQEVENNKILTRNAREQSKLQSNLVGAYEKLNIQRNIAKRNLQDLISAENKNKTAIRAAQREYDVLTKKVNAANQATNNFSKGGIGNVLRGIKNLAIGFGIFGGISFFMDLGKQALDMAKKLDSLNFAMKAIITDTEELARAQYFLQEIADMYGANIVSLTERYIKFTAAAKQSGISMKENEQIFASFTKVSGVLGLRADELNGVFLALEQMLSKGKVTTEELRRQLGERLPGAFGIMAQTLQVLNPDMEITVQTLDDMLKKGEVLSAEVMPEFARQVEKAFGIENVKRVDTIAAASSRLNNAWVNLVGDVTEGGGLINTTIVVVMNAMAGLLDVFSRSSDAIQIDEYKKLSDQLHSNAKAFGAAAKESSNLLDEYQDLTKEGVVPSANEKLRLEQIVLSLTDKLGDSVATLNEETGAMELNTEAVRTMIKAKRLAMDVEASQMAIRYMNAKDSKESLLEQRKIIADELRIRESMITENEKNIEKAIASGAAQYANKPLPESIELRNQTQKELRDIDKQLTEQTKRIESNQAMLSGLGYDDAEIQALLGQADAVEEINNNYANREFIFKKLTEAKQKLEQVNYGDDDTKRAVEAEIAILEKALEYWDGAAKKKGKAIKDYSEQDQFKLAESRLKRELEIQEEIRDNEGKTLEERYEANEAALKKEQELLTLKKDFAVKEAGNRHFLVKALEEEFIFDMEQLSKKGLDRKEKIRSSEFDERVEEFEKIQDANERAMEQEIYNTKKAMHERGATAGEIEKEVEQIKLRYLKENLKNEIEYAIKSLEIHATTEEEKLLISEKIFAMRAKLLDLEIGKEEKVAEKKKLALDEWLMAAADIGGEIGNLFAAFSDRRMVKIEDEMAAMNEMYDKQLANENLTDERRKEIEDERERRTAELEKRKREERIKAAQAEKKFAIFETALNTAAAIVKGLKDGGLPLALIYGALGALQMATIIATPIPKYAKGRKGGKEEMAILGDGGKHEPILDRHGNLKGISPNTPTLMKLDQGDRVLPSTSHLTKDYQSILNASIMTTLASATVNNDSDKLARIFDSKLSKLNDRIDQGIKTGFSGIKLPKNNDISALTRELNFNRKRDAL